MNFTSPMDVSPDYFRAVFEAAGEAMIVTDASGRTFDCNRAALQLYGCNREQLIGSSLLEWSPEFQYDGLASAEKIEEIFSRLDDGGTQGFEWLGCKADRSLIHTRISVGRALLGTQAALVFVSHDISDRKQIEYRLRASEERLRSTLDHSPNVAVQWYDCDGRVIYWNQASERVYGFTADEAMGRTLDQLIYTLADAQAFLVQVRRLIANGGSVGPNLYQTHDKHGNARFVEASTFVIPGDLPGREIVVCMDVDITARVNIETELHLYERVFAHSGEAILITDHDNRIVAVNDAFISLCGYTLEEVRGQNPRMLASGHTPKETYPLMWAALNTHGFWQGELWDRHKDGSVHPKWAAISAIRDSKGAVSHYMASCVDISERKAAEARVDYLARHDVLTGLLNRYSLESQLDQSLRAARRDGSQLAVLFIDLDRFKVINDTLGHQFGDQLLIEVASRLRALSRESDIVARLGGDEFVVVLTGLVSALDAAPLAGKILHALAQPYYVEGRELRSAASIGISAYPGDGEDEAGLMKAADTAMYHGKSVGRNNIQFYTAAMNAAVDERMTLERDLRLAIDNGELALHYQPQFEAGSGRLYGMEALLRWYHPHFGLISPIKFIPIAEESGQIEVIGKWVLDEACRQLALWHAQGGRGVRMAVNLSAHQLSSPQLIETVSAILTWHGLASSDLELEITESVAMTNPERAIEQLRGLRDLGVGLAIDDFGTGYSSLAYLKLLPIQTLKLDQTFVRDIETDENDAAISSATLALAHSLGLKVVAEGVETEGQRAFLVAHRCDYLQGYLLGKPQPGEVWSASDLFLK